MRPNPSLDANPLVSQWLSFAEPGVVLARTGKVELGQGVATALAQVVADALALPLAAVRLVPVATDTSPDEGFTAGSMSVPHSGDALRVASATALSLLRDAAAHRLGVDDPRRDGDGFAAADAHVSIWDLAGDVDLDVPVVRPEGDADPGTRDRVGVSVPRFDLADKVLGRPRFLHDLRLPGTAFGRILHPPGFCTRLVEVDTDSVAALPGVLSVVVDGDLVGVVARTEVEVVAALDALRAATRWGEPEPGAPDTDRVDGFLRSAPTEDSPIADEEAPGGGSPNGGPDLLRHSASYSRPFLAHASIGPSCAAAVWTGDDVPRVEVWTHSQGVHPLRRDIARALGVDADRVTVRHVEGAGCYGHNPADDVAYDAVLLARSLPGTPVHVTWTRESELSWGPLGPAMSVTITSGCDADGTLRTWEYEAWGNGHTSRPSTLPSPSLLGYALQAGGEPVPASQDPPAAAGFGVGRNGIPGYRVPRIRGTVHRLEEMPVRASALRSLGAHLNVFAIESHLDDLAASFGVDPVEYRLRHLDDPRGRAVLERVAELSDWGSAVTGEATGRGVGFARYKGKGAWCAVVVELVAEADVRLTRAWIAADVGEVVNPDGAVNQLEGGALQSASWTLREQVRLDGGRVTSDTWETYPILRFSEMPTVEVALLDRPGTPPLGAGEASVGPTAAAIGNAVHAALGVRVRDLPLTAERIVAAMPD